MYKLSPQGMKLVKQKNIRRKVANAMGVSESAVYMSVNSGGKSIATNYDALNVLSKEGFKVEQVREKINV